MRGWYSTLIFRSLSIGEQRYSFLLFILCRFNSYFQNLQLSSISSLNILNLLVQNKNKWEIQNMVRLFSAEGDANGDKDDTPLLPPPLPPLPPPLPLVEAGQGGCQGAILGLIGLGLVPGIGMLESLGLVSVPPVRTWPKMKTMNKMLSGMFGLDNYPMSLLNWQYLNPRHPKFHILTSILTPTLHGMKVLFVSTHQLNSILQSKCGGPRGQCVSSHLNTRSDVTNITRTYALLCLKVHMRAWSATWLLRCRRTRIRIVHRGLLQNWHTTSK